MSIEVSRREAVLQAIHTRLQSLQTDPNTYWGEKIKAVERRVLSTDGTQPDLNTGDVPAIFFWVSSESSAPIGSSEIERSLEITIRFELGRRRADCNDLGGAITDLEYALLKDWASASDAFSSGSISLGSISSTRWNGGDESEIGVEVTVSFSIVELIGNPYDLGV